MTSIDFENEKDICSYSISDLTSSMKSTEKKMSDITDLLDAAEFVHEESISTNFVDYLRTHRFEIEEENYQKSSGETGENYLKDGSKQLTPSDYLTRTSLYNRPVAFEKTSRSWARSLLNNFQKSHDQSPSKSSSSSVHLTYFFPVIKHSSSFDHHVQYIEHLNECNDYPAYLEYLRENRSQLFYTLTDSIDLIDGLIGTMVSSF